MRVKPEMVKAEREILRVRVGKSEENLLLEHSCMHAVDNTREK